MRALASLTLLFVAFSTQGAAVPAVETAADGSVRVIAGGTEIVSSFGLVFPDMTRAAPARPGRNPIVAVEDAQYELASSMEALGGGTMTRLDALQMAARHETVWTELPPVRVRLELHLGDAMRDGALVVDDSTLISLSGGRPESVFNGETVPLARKIEFIPRREESRLFLRLEAPCEVALVNRGDEVVLVIGETVFEPRRPIRMAAWFGSSDFSGGPVFVSRPEAVFNRGLGCFEISLRAMGVSDEAHVWSSAGGGGFREQRFEVVGGAIEPRGWPSRVLRLPAEVGGRTISVFLRSGASEIASDVVLPGVNARRFLTRHGAVSGPSFVFSSESSGYIERLAEEQVVAARMELDVPAQGMDPELAWRLDRLFEVAGEKGVAVKVAAEVGGQSATLAFIREAGSRWSAVRGWRGIELPFAAFDDDPARIRQAAETAAEVDPRHPLAVRIDPARLKFLAGLPVVAAVTVDLAGATAGGFHPESYAVMGIPPGTDEGTLWRSALGGWQEVFFRRAEALELSRFLSARPTAGPFAGTKQFEDLEFRAFVTSGPRSALWYLSAHAHLVEDIEFELQGIAPGHYRVEWWNPGLGRIQTSYVVRSFDGRVPLRLSGFAGAVAGRLVPAGPSLR